MKRMLALALILPISCPATAQVSVMVRIDLTDLATEKNVPDSLEKVQERAAAIGGEWETLLANDTTCGGGAVAIARSMRDRRYFLVTGKKTAAEANTEAMREANEFVKANRGWITSAGPSWFNKNAYRQSADGMEWVLQETVGMNRCDMDTNEGRAMGKRG
ncbi:hypothetical protein [Erythrobacter sp. A6_0]|uniref:hypothetical protein n=1 Tax=Erythrobacter sp. A6_0 TaxID=2821089 RepID=UPI001ADB6399|nr:hypothetical protein [Erythrobacter sp. A6_0]MBO9511678.1 hypothetical protein [Erythrobacter sp. A6_0]